ARKKGGTPETVFRPATEDNRRGHAAEASSVSCPPQSREEPPRIPADRRRAVAPFLDDQSRQVEGADQLAIPIEIRGAEAPGSGRVAPGGVEPQRDDEVGRGECADVVERLAEGAPVPVAVELLGERIVPVESEAGARTAFVAEPGEVRVGEGGVTMEREREHVASLPEDVLRRE